MLRICDTPPASHCDDTDSFYITYPATGTCDPGQGECEYPPVQVACTNCAQTCLSACAGLLCPDQNGGCKSQGICDPESVTCQYTTSNDGVACDLPNAAVGSHGGTCLTGVCNAASYAWESASWGACSTSCGSGTQSRTVVCRRTADNTTVADSFCTGTKPATSQSCNETTGCGYAWSTNNWSACSTTCGSGTQSRTVVCRRSSDNAVVADSNCTGVKPDAAQACNDSSGCAYTWGTGTWNACSNSCGSGTQTRTVECRRTSDNATVADSFCTGVKPSTSQACTDTVGCSYAWQAGSWGSCSTTCGTGTQTRAVVCKRSSDNITVADANCTTSKPATTQSCTDNSGCAPSCIVNAEGRANQHWAAQLSSTNATTCTFSIDGAAPAVIPAGCNFPLTEDTGAVFTPGNHVLTIYATGATGSTSCTDTFVILPRPACTFSMTSPAPGSVTYNVASTDTTSCTVTINGGAPGALDPCTFTRTETVGAGYYVLVISVYGPGGDNTCSDDVTVVN